MTVKEVKEDLLYSFIDYKESKHYRLHYEVRPVFTWVHRNKESKVDKIQKEYDYQEKIPLKVKRFYKGFRVEIFIDNISSESELKDIQTEIMTKFKIINENKIKVYRPYIKFWGFKKCRFNFHSNNKIRFYLYDYKQIYSFTKYRELGEYIVSR